MFCNCGSHQVYTQNQVYSLIEKKISNMTSFTQQDRDRRISPNLRYMLRSQWDVIDDLCLVLECFDDEDFRFDMETNATLWTGVIRAN